jgi:hypothetical protein
LTHLQVDTTEQTKVHEIWMLARSNHRRHTDTATTNLQIIYGADNSRQRTAYGLLASVGSDGRIDNPKKGA